MKFMVTGANGFVGKALCAELVRRAESVCAAVRSANSVVENTEMVSVGEINDNTDWADALIGVNVVIHLAARVHVMKDDVADPLAEFRRVNVLGTFNLARQAAKAGVQRFIFISSIKVHGEETLLGQPFTEIGQPAPDNAYAMSKWEAELALLQLGSETGMEVVIIRSPLVYGPGVKANFLSMMRWLHKGIPLPLASIYNKRSLVAADNLVDLIVTCVVHPAVANQVFLVADGEDVSTTELLQRLGKALGKTPRLLSVPAWMVKFVAALFGKKMEVQRLYSSLQVDISKTRNLLNWTPPVSVDEALRKTAQHFLESQSR